MGDEGYISEALTVREMEVLRLVALGLSNRDIAEELVVAPETVRWYTKQIYAKLGISGRIHALNRARALGLLEDGTHDNTKRVVSQPPLPSHHLPAALTPFIGRTHEIAKVRRLLQTARLLTLTGVGGTGKTRLALRVASEALNEFTDGAYFVDLAPLSTHTRVANAIAGALGLASAVSQPLTDNLKHHLRQRQLLLVLDNFEHMLAGAPLVSELLAAAPDLKVLVTSREALHLYGEQEYLVPPLTLPEPACSGSVSELAACESVALFVQQARAVKPDFELNPENALEVAKICVRLDGLPLAIELSASRIKLLTPETLLARLNSRLEALAGGARDLPTRQQTLRNTIEWSYNLLNEGEKTLFARLAVFRGGWTLNAMEVICGVDLPIDVFDGLESLVNKSLVQQKELPSGEPRFMMLETLHEYAWERLKASGEAETLCRRQAEYFVQLAERAEPELRLSKQQHWFRTLETEHENMRTVLQWSLEGGDRTLGARLAGALHLFWYAYGHHVDGQHWIQQLLEPLDMVDPIYHSKLLFAAGHVIMLYDLERAKPYFEQALHLSREAGNKTRLAWSLILLGYTMMHDMEAAITTTEEGLALFRKLNHKPGMAQALNIIGEIARAKGDDERARHAYEECLAIAQETGETRRIRFMFGNLGFLAQHAGDYERARELEEQALRLALEMNNKLDIADALANLAGILGIIGQPERAASLFGAWEAALERLGAVPQPSNTLEFERNIAAVHAQLDPKTFESAWVEGRAMSLEEAVAFALGHRDARVSPTVPASSASGDQGRGN